MKLTEWFCEEMEKNVLIVRADLLGGWEYGTMRIQLWAQHMGDDPFWGGVGYSCYQGQAPHLTPAVFPVRMPQAECAKLATERWVTKGWRQRKVEVYTFSQRVRSREVAPGEEVDSRPAALGHPIVLQHLARLHSALHPVQPEVFSTWCYSAVPRLEGLIKRGNRELDQLLSMP